MATMFFSEALVELRKGKEVLRSNWNRLAKTNGYRHLRLEQNSEGYKRVSLYITYPEGPNLDQYSATYREDYLPDTDDMVNATDWMVLK